MSTTPDDLELDRLAAHVGERLRAAHDRVVTAESCTGGWIAKAMTGVAGSSDWFDSGMVAYSYEAKQALLGVRPQTLESQGAVSRETVIEMVSGALVHSGASVAVAVTGIAGPGGGSTDKPVGTVWIGVAGPKGAYAQKFLFARTRERNIGKASIKALQLLLEEIEKK